MESIEKNKPSKRTRLTPHERRMQLLDSAALVIQEKGLSNLTIEAVAKTGKVSAPLIYKYFETRLELLRQLLRREHQRFVDQSLSRLRNASELWLFIEVIVRSYFEEYSRRDLLDTLQNESEVLVGALDIKKLEQENIFFYIQNRIAHEFTLNAELAGLTTRWIISASKASAEYFRLHGGNAEQQVLATLQFLREGIANQMTENKSKSLEQPTV